MGFGVLSILEMRRRRQFKHFQRADEGIHQDERLLEGFTPKFEVGCRSNLSSIAEIGC
jgi:hypothetical protein